MNRVLRFDLLCFLWPKPLYGKQKRDVCLNPCSFFDSFPLIFSPQPPLSLWTSWPSDPDRHHAMEAAAALGAALTEGGREAGGRLARGPSSLPEAPHPSALLECARDLAPVLAALMEVVLEEMVSAHVMSFLLVPTHLSTCKNGSFHHRFGLITVSGLAIPSLPPSQKRSARGVSNSLCGPARTALCLSLRSLPLAASALEVQGHMDRGLGAVFEMVPYLDAARRGGEVSELAQAWLDGVVPYLQ